MNMSPYPNYQAGYVTMHDIVKLDNVTMSPPPFQDHL